MRNPYNPYDTMSFAIGMAKDRIIHAIKQYVLDKGEDYCDYDRDEFGIDEEDEGKVLKVLDILNNGGCYFPLTVSHAVDNNTKFEHYDFQCLYVVKDEDGQRYLKYYMLYSEGTEFDEEGSEPEHECVDCLPLQVLDKLISFIGYYDQK